MTRRILVHLDSFRYRGSAKDLLCNVHLTINHHRVSALLGLSGVGKSTLMSVLLGVADGRLRGKVAYDDGEALLCPKLARTKGILGWIGQGAHLTNWLTVQENLALPMKLNPAIPRVQVDDFAAWLRRAALERDVLWRHPSALSVGMRQRIVFVRCLLYRPRFLLLDEAFSGLDVLTRDSALGMLKQALAEPDPPCCLFVTHDLDLAQELAQDVFILTRDDGIHSAPAGLKRADLVRRLRSDLASQQD